MKKQRVCLITHTHIASNPRLVKEANALHRAGFQVKVISGDIVPFVRVLDQTLLSKSLWDCTQVDRGSLLAYGLRTLSQRGARMLAGAGWIPHLSIATWAHYRLSHRLAKVAASEPADLYIAHNLAALPAAAAAARLHKAKLGFDAEDFHVGELSETPENAAEIAVRDCLERNLLPRCEHLTAASPGIAKAYEKRYQISMEPILNVFPLEEAPASCSRQEGDRCGSEPSLYWFSQTIGSDRGLESIVRAMGRMRTKVRLHLRGTPANGFVEILQRLAKEVGVTDRLHLLAPAAPAEMVRLAACHDIGLSTEMNLPINRALCLTNKVFTYLLAGLPQLMSRTCAQTEMAQELGEAALLVNINDVEKLASTLDHILSDQTRLERRRKTAWQLGQERYNWDVEQRDFLQVVEKTLNS